MLSDLKGNDASERRSGLPLSIQPNPAYFVSSRAGTFERICNLIDRSDGGVFAVTGVRGAGKSVLLQNILERYRNMHHTVSLAAPIGFAQEMDFFIALFRLLCDSAVKRLRSTIFSDTNDLRQIGLRQALSYRLVLSTLIILIGLGITLGVLYSADSMRRSIALRSADVVKTNVNDVYKLKIETARSQNTTLVGNLNNDIERINAAEEKINSSNWFTFVTDAQLGELAQAMREANGDFHYTDDPTPKYPALFSLLSDARIAIVILLFALLIIILYRVFLRVLDQVRRIRNAPEAYGLLLESNRLGEYLDYELTRTQVGEVSIPFVKEITARFQKSSELKIRSLSLPSLTNQYIAFVTQLLEVCGPKLVVCIDELDKITDSENVRAILREIKGGLYVKNCFYIVSLSEDALQAFGNRLSATRDIFESTFDDVFTLDRLSVSDCREIVSKRLSHNELAVLGDDSDRIVTLCCILSSGIPRDLIRNLRDCIFGPPATTAKKTLQSCWSDLFIRKLEEILRHRSSVRVQSRGPRLQCCSGCTA